jgi:uncharacterized membrane protein
MGNFLTNIRAVAWTSLVVAVGLLVIWANAAEKMGLSAQLIESLLRWVHVLAGIMWIGHLYYFNFTQIPNVPKIPEEHRGPAISKVIAPAALYWFRWGAMLTIAAGVLLAAQKGYLLQAYSFNLIQPATPVISDMGAILIGIGMWLGTIMWFNVWFIIWPNQQKALNIDNKYPDLAAEEKAKSARTAMLFSRTNTLLSAPMLLAMTAVQTIGY